MNLSRSVCRVLILLVAGTLGMSAGCLRHRLASDEEGIGSRRPIVRQNFGRAAEERGQAGIDDRAREIESSLGVEGDVPRLFNR